MQIKPSTLQKRINESVENERVSIDVGLGSHFFYRYIQGQNGDVYIRASDVVRHFIEHDLPRAAKQLSMRTGKEERS